jgi:hypothetical protein
MPNRGETRCRCQNIGAAAEHSDPKVDFPHPPHVELVTPRGLHPVGEADAPGEAGLIGDATVSCCVGRPPTQPTAHSAQAEG